MVDLYVRISMGIPELLVLAVVAGFIGALIGARK